MTRVWMPIVLVGYFIGAAGLADTRQQSIAATTQKKVRDQLLSGMRELIKNEPAPKKQKYEAAIQQAEKIQDAEASIHALMSVQALVVEDLIQTYPTDMDAQVAFIGAQSALASTFQTQEKRKEEGKRLAEKSEQHAKSLIDRFPRAGRPHLLLGVLHGRAGRIPEAAKEFEKCLELDPSNVDCKQNIENIRPPQKKKKQP